MRYAIHYDPIAHIIIDEFFDRGEYEHVFTYIKYLENLMHDGKVVTLNNEVSEVNLNFKKVKNIWPYEVDDVIAEKFCSLIEKKLWSSEMRDLYLKCRDSAFQYFNETNRSNILLSKYELGDHYEWHKDINTGMLLTGNIWISEDNVCGGNLVLSNNLNETKEIEYRNNVCIFFPSHTQHKVTEVLNVCKRFSIQYFSSMVYNKWKER